MKCEHKLQASKKEVKIEIEALSFLFNSYRQDFPFIFLLIFGFRFQIKSSCSFKSPLESSASVPTLTHLSGIDPHYGPLFRNEDRSLARCRLRRKMSVWSILTRVQTYFAGRNGYMPVDLLLTAST